MKDATAVVKQAGKPYTPPQMMEYGHIEKLTRGTAGANADHGTKKAA